MITKKPLVTLSIVSHRQLELIKSLLDDLECYVPFDITVVLTLNVAEPVNFDIRNYSYPIILIKNQEVKGFGSNHNTAFSQCDTPFFCILNPDVKLLGNPFPQLIKSLIKNHVAMCAPIIVNSNGDLEDSIRFFPTPRRLFKKILTGKHAVHPVDANVAFPHWVAGMFMLFASKAYQSLRGFDERYFLYYEDVDICARIWKSDMRLLVDQRVKVIHDAQRASHKSLKYLRWHLTSMCRFFIYHLCNLPNPDPQTGLLARD